LLLAAPWGPHP